MESSTCRRRPPGTSPNERRMTSGPSDEPPMPSSTASVNPAARHSCANSLSSGACSSIVSETGQPAEAVLDLRHAGATPQRRVAAPDALGDVLGHGLLDALGDRLLQLARQAAFDRRRAAGGDRRAVLLDPGQQPAHRVLELLHAVDEQLVGHLAAGRCRPRAAPRERRWGRARRSARSPCRGRPPRAGWPSASC